MSIVDVSELVRIFFKYPISYIPIIDENAAGDSYLVGFLSRKKILHYSSDKERLSQTFDRIPDIFISKEIYPEHIWEFFEKSPIPVYNIFAKYIDSWQKNEINYNLKHFIYTLQSNIIPEEKNESKDDNIDYEKIKLLEMILSSLPFPVVALDTEGNGIFYNEHFLKEIVDQGPFKKTLALAEAYFKEVVRKVIPDYILKNLNTEFMIWDWNEYNKKIYITNLVENNQVYAYLLTFLSNHNVTNSSNIYTVQKDTKMAKTDLIHLIEEQLKNNKNYDEIIDNLESQIIKDYLVKHHYNITNTANALKIKRTTLQNKMKRLNLQKDEKSKELSTQDRPKEDLNSKETKENNKINQENYKETEIKKKRASKKTINYENNNTTIQKNKKKSTRNN